MDLSCKVPLEILDFEWGILTHCSRFGHQLHAELVIRVLDLAVLDIGGVGRCGSARSRPLERRQSPTGVFR
jgi:hypothetical protein